MTTQNFVVYCKCECGRQLRDASECRPLLCSCGVLRTHGAGGIGFGGVRGDLMTVSTEANARLRRS